MAPAVPTFVNTYTYIYIYMIDTRVGIGIGLLKTFQWVNNPTRFEFCFKMIGRADIDLLLPGEKGGAQHIPCCQPPFLPSSCFGFRHRHNDYYWRITLCEWE